MFKQLTWFGSAGGPCAAHLFISFRRLLSFPCCRHTKTNKHAHSAKREAEIYELMAESHLKQLYMFVRVCAFECLCVRERQRHEERIIVVTVKKSYREDEEKNVESSCFHSITYQRLWLCNETYCSSVLTVSYDLICLFKEIHWQESRYDLLLLFAVWSLTSSSSSCNHFPRPQAAFFRVCSSLPVMRSHETESDA